MHFRDLKWVVAKQAETCFGVFASSPRPPLKAAACGIWAGQRQFRDAGLSKILVKSSLDCEQKPPPLPTNRNSVNKDLEFATRVHACPFKLMLVEYLVPKQVWQISYPIPMGGRGQIMPATSAWPHQDFWYSDTPGQRHCWRLLAPSTFFHATMDRF